MSQTTTSGTGRGESTWAAPDAAGDSLARAGFPSDTALASSRLSFGTLNLFLRGAQP